MANKHVYRFNEGNKDMKELLGGKGANLAEMTGIGLPVPPGFTITTEVCNHYSQHGGYPDGVEEQVDAALKALEADTGKRFGDSGDPLLLSVRSGARASMPGMMDTILNLGLNDETVRGRHRRHRQRALRLRLLPPLRQHVRATSCWAASPRTRTSPTPSRSSSTARRRPRAPPSTPTSPPTTSRSSSRSSRRRPSSAPAASSPRTRSSSSGAPSPPSSAPGTTTAPSPTAASTTSPTRGARP